MKKEYRMTVSVAAESAEEALFSLRGHRDDRYLFVLSDSIVEMDGFVELFPEVKQKLLYSRRPDTDPNEGNVRRWLRWKIENAWMYIRCRLGLMALTNADWPWKDRPVKIDDEKLKEICRRADKAAQAIA